MSDTRTLRQKLEAMADQVVSPHEAAIAAAKLEAMGQEPPPPTRPTAVGGMDVPGWKTSFRTWTTNGMYSSDIVWTRVVWPGDERYKE